MCDENNLEQCGPAGATLLEMDKAWFEYCNNTIYFDNNEVNEKAKLCNNFYNDKYLVNDTYIQLNSKSKEEKEYMAAISACQSNIINRDKCISLANDSPVLKNYIKNACSGDSGYKEICKSICDSNLSNQQVKELACGTSFTLYIIFLLIVVTSIYIFFRQKKKAINVKKEKMS